MPPSCVDLPHLTMSETAPNSPTSQATVAGTISPASSKAPAPESEALAHLVTIDADGDVILSVTDSDARINRGRTCDFLVSSKVLTLASPVLAKIFRSSSLEGNKLPLSPSLPIIRLKGDDPDAMHELLRHCHFDTEYLPDRISDMRTLAKLAVVSDSYDCLRVVRPWAILWLHMVSTEMATSFTQVELGWWVLAAYFFRSSQFSIITGTVVPLLRADFVSIWDQDRLLQTYMPDAIRGSWNTRHRDQTLSFVSPYEY